MVWTIIYARVHAAEYSWSIGRRQLGDFLQSLPWTADGLFWITAGLGLASLALVKGERRKKFWLAGLLVFSIAAVSLSNYFSEHYFVMLLPALCLLAGQAVSAAMQWSKAWAALPAGLVVLMWIVTVFHHRAVFFVLSPDQVCKSLYRANPFIECRQISRYISEHSAPDARIAILGSEPEILFYARRRSATGYLAMYDLTAPHPYAREMQREMIAEIEAARPEYLIFFKQPVSWDLRLDFDRAMNTDLLAWVPKFAQDFYEPIGEVIVKPESEYYWGNDMPHRSLAGEQFISIYKRK